MQKNRPKIELPLTKVEKIVEMVSLILVCFTIFNLLTNFGKLPQKIPSHFGVSGLPDAWGNRTSILFLPAVMVFLYVQLTVIGRSPHKFNYLVEINENNALFQYKNARMLISFLKFEIIAALAYAAWITCLAAQGKKEGLGAGFLPLFLLAIFSTIGISVLRMLKNNSR